MPDLLLIQASPDLDPARLYKRLRQAREGATRAERDRDVREMRLAPTRLRAGRRCCASGRHRANRGNSRAVRSLHTADGLGERPLLTRRELEILRLVAEGRTNRDVAELLWVSDQTVKFHLANVYRKLGVNTRAEAVEWARTNDIGDVATAEDRLAARPHFPAKLH